MNTIIMSTQKNHTLSSAHTRGDFINRTSTIRVIQTWLIVKVAEALGLSPEQIDPAQPLASYGIGSVEALGLVGDLEEWLMLQISPSLIWDYPTISTVAHYLAGEVQVQSTMIEQPQ